MTVPQNSKKSQKYLIVKSNTANRDLNVSLKQTYTQREEKLLKTHYRALICFVLVTHSWGESCRFFWFSFLMKHIIGFCLFFRSHHYRSTIHRYGLMCPALHVLPDSAAFIRNPFMTFLDITTRQ